MTPFFLPAKGTVATIQAKKEMALDKLTPREKRLKRLEERRFQIEADIAALKNEIYPISQFIAAMNGHLGEMKELGADSYIIENDGVNRRIRYIVQGTALREGAPELRDRPMITEKCPSCPGK